MKLGNNISNSRWWIDPIVDLTSKIGLSIQTKVIEMGALFSCMIVKEKKIAIYENLSMNESINDLSHE